MHFFDGEDGKVQNGLEDPMLAHRTPSNGSSASSDRDPLRLDGLTVLEKKCRLINCEIDRQGMGKYQWCIWGLCGFGYMIDLIWAHAFGLVLSPLQQELGFGNDQSGNISTSFNAGLTAGAFAWGFVSDIVGRRWAFNLTCLFASIFGLCLGASQNYNTFLILTAFVGFGVGGNVPIDTTIAMEFIPQPIGVIITSAIALAFIPSHSCSPNFSEPGALPSCATAPSSSTEPCCSKSDNMGWRYLLFTLGGITTSVFILRFFVFKFHETPKFLVYRGRDAEALHTLQRMAKKNGQECLLTIEDLSATGQDSSSYGSEMNMGSIGGGKMRQQSAKLRKNVTHEASRYMMLFNSFGMARLTIFTWLTYAMDFWGFTVAGHYLPRILALKNGAASVSLTSTYTAYVYTYSPGILGVLLGTVMYRIPNIGRKWTMMLSAAMMGVSIFLFAIVDTRAKNEGMFTMEYFFQSMFNAVLYGWTPTAFPASVRGTACGVASFWGRLAGIVSPLIAQNLYGRSEGANGDGDINSVLYLAGGVTLGCVISVALLPNHLMEAKGEESYDES